MSDTGTSDPTTATGDVASPSTACQCHDVEAVSDLEEPNTIEFESGPEDDEPAALVFCAQATDSGGKSVNLDGAASEEQAEEGLSESDLGGEDEPSASEDDEATPTSD